MQGDARHTVGRIKPINRTPIKSRNGGAGKCGFGPIKCREVVLGARHFYTPSKVLAYIGADDAAPNAKGFPVVG